MINKAQKEEMKKASGSLKELLNTKKRGFLWYLKLIVALLIELYNNLKTEENDN